MNFKQLRGVGVRVVLCLLLAGGSALAGCFPHGQQTVNFPEAFTVDYSACTPDELQTLHGILVRYLVIARNHVWEPGALTAQDTGGAFELHTQSWVWVPRITMAQTSLAEVNRLIALGNAPQVSDAPRSSVDGRAPAAAPGPAPMDAGVPGTTPAR